MNIKRSQIANAIFLLMVIAAGSALFTTFRGGGKWQITVSEDPGQFELKVENPKKQLERAISFESRGVAGAEPEVFVLPDDRDRFPYGEITFLDQTVLPGRVTLMINGTEIDIMVRGLFVDGTEYSWAEPEPIRVGVKPEPVDARNGEKPAGGERSP